MMDIKFVDDNSLVGKTIELAIQFGATPDEHREVINAQLKIGEAEILRRLKDKSVKEN